MNGVKMFKVVKVMYGRCGYEGISEVGMLGVGGSVKVKKDIGNWISCYVESVSKEDLSKGCDGSYSYSCVESNDVYYFVLSGGGVCQVSQIIFDSRLIIN